MPVRSHAGGGLVLALLALFGQLSARAESFVFHHEHVLGTSLEIQLRADSPAAAEAAEARILAEIDRLAKIFSGYDPTSEFSRWQASPGEQRSISPELLSALAASEQWQQRSGGAFNPAVETLTQLWKAAEKHGRLPSDDELSNASQLVQQPQWQLDRTASTATRLPSAALSLNGIAKGLIIDRASQAALAGQSGVQGVVVNIGGDLCVSGTALQPVETTDPSNDAVSAPPVSRIYLQGGAVATSGNYRRGFDIAGRHYSHVLDPRTGRPTEHLSSATVVAKTTADANALAVILQVLPLDQGLALANSMPAVEYLLIQKGGQRIRSRGWKALEQPPQLGFVNAQADQEKSAPSKDVAESSERLQELVVNFELQPVTGGGRYRRPYVAVWLEDEDAFPVRTALLWLTTKEPGPRWHRDLLRWHRNDGVRKVADGTDLIATIASATRGPGKYTALFNGKDDAGKPLAAGNYTLYVEVAREHGTYQLIRHPLKLGTEPIAQTQLKPNAEIKSASFEYRNPAAQGASQPAGN